MGSVFGKLPALSFELEVVGNEGPIERRHPVGDEVVFLYPGLVVGVVGRELDGCEVVNIVVGMPVAEGQLC